MWNFILNDRPFLDTKIAYIRIKREEDVADTEQMKLLYSWRFSRHSSPIHWLVHGHMTSNNETVSRQMPSANNIAKTMTSNSKQFTVTRKTLTTVARDQSVQLKVA